MPKFSSALIATCVMTAACSQLENVGRAPDFTPVSGGEEQNAMMNPGQSRDVSRAQGSLWNGGRDSLLGDRRAMQRGDIMTVLININDSAQFSNSSSRARDGSSSMGIGSLFGIPQRINENLPEGASMDNALDVGSSTSHNGTGAISRNEQLELRIAATVTDVLPNGLLAIHGTQEVRVNFELRELTITGFVRPEDISRQNQITYDKIASARISYGGRGQITDVQQPPYGQQVTDIIMPF